MRTVKLNVLVLQVKWMKQHREAHLTVDEKGEVLAATYLSPLMQWRGLIAPDGTVNVPDMDYYNSHPSMAEMLEVIDELSQEGKP